MYWVGEKSMPRCSQKETASRVIARKMLPFDQVDARGSSFASFDTVVPLPYLYCLSLPLSSMIIACALMRMRICGLPRNYPSTKIVARRFCKTAFVSHNMCFAKIP